MDLAGAFTFKRAVDKFKDNLRPKLLAPGDGSSPESLPTILGRAIAGSRGRPSCLVFSLTIVDVDNAKLAADKAATQALEAAIKESVIDSADSIGPDDVALTMSAAESGAGAEGDWLGALG